MELDVKNLLFAPTGETDNFDVDLSNVKEDEEVLAEKISGKVHLIRLEEEILAQFSGSVKVKIICDRCLAEYETEIPLKFSQEYVVSGEPDDEIKLLVSKDNRINFAEPLRQEILAALPVKKLCKKGCQGLCPGCGADLNTQKCKCNNKKV